MVASANVFLYLMVAFLTLLVSFRVGFSVDDICKFNRALTF